VVYVCVRGLQRALQGTKETADVPLFVAVDKPGRNCTNVRAGTNQEENDEQQRLEVEERGLIWSTPTPP
jgi:hypothetical protein